MNKLVTILLLGLGAAPALAQGEIGNVCAGDFVNPANCTANDVLLEAFFVQTVIEDCAEGVPFEAEVVFEALVTNNSPNRYGIGVFVALDGGSAVTGDMCLHDYLAPFSGNPDDWVLNGTTYSEPFPNLNGDLCGDIPGGFSAQKPLQQVRIACNDADGDGFVDIHACSSWENNAQAECNGLQDATPGTPAKCGCETVATTIPLPAAVTIVKETTKGDGGFEFNSDLPGGGFTITTIGGTGQRGPIAVNPGTHTISEVVPKGWILDSATCDNGDSPDSLSVAPGDQVTCTFTNSPIGEGEPNAAITIVKQTTSGNGAFNYSGDLGAFGITTAGGGGSRTFNELDPGTYEVAETIPDGWTLESITCSNGASSTNPGNASATVVVAEDEQVTCTFTNRPVVPGGPNGSITIVKQTTGGNGTSEFTGALGPFEIITAEGSGSKNYGQLVAGTYIVKEKPRKGWKLKSIACSNAESSIDLASGTATVVLADDEQVTCTYVNQVVQVVPTLPWVAAISLMMLLASAAVWTLRRAHA